MASPIDQAAAYSQHQTDWTAWEAARTANGGNSPEAHAACAVALKSALLVLNQSGYRTMIGF